MIFLDCLQLLVGDSNFKTALPNEVTADEFAENVLGFEEVEEEGEEGDEEEPSENKLRVQTLRHCWQLRLRVSSFVIKRTFV
jgi:hypothetical protein